MKVLFNEVKTQIENIDLGSYVEVLVANGTRTNNSSPYFLRKGILLDKKDNNETIILGVNKRKYTIYLRHAKHWVDEQLVETEYANNLYSITRVAE